MYLGSLDVYAIGLEVDWPIKELLEPPSGHSAMRKAATVIQQVISINLQGISPYITLVNDGTLERGHSVGGGVLPSIYLHLQEIALGSSTYYRCAYRRCDKWWPKSTQGRGRERFYCPNDKKGDQSLCAKNEAYYRDRDKKSKTSAQNYKEKS